MLKSRLNIASHRAAGSGLGVQVSSGVGVGLNVDEAKWITEPFSVRTESAANQFTIESFLQKRLHGGPGLEWRRTGSGVTGWRRGVGSNPLPTDGLIFHAVVTLFVESCLFKPG